MVEEIPTLEKEIESKRAEWKAFHDGTLIIPTDPIEAQKLHDLIGEQLKELINQNEIIKQTNRAALIKQNEDEVNARLLYEATDEYKWKVVRETRNGLLRETDWTVLPDVSVSEDFKIYRKQLRDIPQTYKNVDDVVFPTKPLE